MPITRLKKDKSVPKDVGGSGLVPKASKLAPTHAYGAGVKTSNAWESKDPKIIDFVSTSKTVPCAIPEPIYQVCRGLDAEYPSVEWSILVKGSWDVERDMFVLEDEYFLPQQEVSGAHVDYEEDNPDFNGVIHKHPGGVTSFSATDESYINRNFIISLLWVNHDFHYGIANTRSRDMGATRIRLKLKPIPMQDHIAVLPENHAEKIKERSYAYKRSYAYSGSQFGGLGNWQGRGNHNVHSSQGAGMRHQGTQNGKPGYWQGGVFHPTEGHGSNDSSSGMTGNRSGSAFAEDADLDPDEDRAGGGIGGWNPYEDDDLQSLSGVPDDDDDDDGKPLGAQSYNDMDAEEWEAYMESIDHEYAKIPAWMWK